MHRLTTCGIDIGSSAIKVAILEEDPGGEVEVRALEWERLRRRDPRQVLRAVLDRALDAARVSSLRELAYVASTGEGDLAEGIRTGHFYGMTSHARGGIFLDPRARSIIDVGALHARAIRIDERGKVLSYRMTSQCASGTGQFVENIARYLGVRLDEIGRLSLEALRAEPVSGICAVLAETDVINMVSRGIPTGEILRGIHESVAGRLAKLLRTAKAEAPVLITGGLASDAGLVGALRERLSRDRDGGLEVITHPRSVYAGALGAGLWGAFRARKLAGALPLSDDMAMA